MDANYVCGCGECVEWVWVAGCGECVECVLTCGCVDVENVGFIHIYTFIYIHNIHI